MSIEYRRRYTARVFFFFFSTTPRARFNIKAQSIFVAAADRLTSRISILDKKKNKKLNNSNNNNTQISLINVT